MQEYIEFCQKINLDDNTISIVSDCYNKNRTHILDSTNIFLNNKERKFLQFEDKLFTLSLVIAIAIKAHDDYIKRGIDDNIYYDTMKDITIWANEYHKNTQKFGLENVGWIFLHLTLSIFKIGRLQFQPTIVPYVPLIFYCKHKKIKIPFKKQCINIHIPRGEKLDYNECIKSIRMSKDFFKQFYPEINLDNYMIISWLVDPRLTRIVNKESNIYKFQSLFNVVRILPTKKDTNYYVFGTKKIKDIKNLPENTSLQRKIKSYYLKGHSLGIGLGFLDFENL